MYLVTPGNDLSLYYITDWLACQSLTLWQQKTSPLMGLAEIALFAIALYRLALKLALTATSGMQAFLELAYFELRFSIISAAMFGGTSS